MKPLSLPFLYLETPSGSSWGLFMRLTRVSAVYEFGWVFIIRLKGTFV